MWRKDRKKLKKELSLNYTVMLLPHSQDKPVHFRIPVWVFIAAFLSLFTLLSLTLFFSFSSYRLKGAAQQKKLLEAELRQMETEKARLNGEKERLASDNLKIAEENSALMESQREQEAQLEELKALSNQVARELEELNERENKIRGQLGIEEEEPAPEPKISTVSQSAGGSNLARRNQAYNVIAGALPGVLSLKLQNPSSPSAWSLEQEFLFLQNSIERQESSYDSMSGEIDRAAAERQSASVRQRIISYALQFVGNPYVYGGNDPHSGVDCSGFSRYVLSHVAGVSLNRTASSQSRQGASISIADARPGDLIFYGSGGGVNHVAIYIGDGRVVHASNEKTGIIVSNWDYRTPVAIKDVIN